MDAPNAGGVGQKLATFG